MAETCTRTTKGGAPCKAHALPGKNYCFAHDPANLTTERKRNAQAAQAAQRRRAKSNTLEAFRDVTQERILDVAGRCLAGVPLDQPHSVSNYFGPREATPEGVYVGLMLLIALTQPHATPSAARAALLEALPESMRPNYVPPVEDVYKAGRAEWRRGAINYAQAAGLFTTPYPEHLIAPWEDREVVEANEPMPEVTTYTVEPLGDSTTHVLAKTPTGEEIIVRRMDEIAAAVSETAAA